MTDDYLADFERELHAAARRRRTRAAGSAPRRVASTLAAAAAIAAVALVLPLAGSPEREVEVPAGPAPDGTVALTALAPAASSACAPERRRVAAPDRMGVFRRSQHPLDASADGEAESVAAADWDPDGTRSPTGIGERVLLSPTSGVGCDRRSEAGVCLIAAHGHKCFTHGEIEAGRALVLVEPGKVAGLVLDGVESVVLESAGARVETSAVENAFLAQLPRTASAVEVTLRAAEAGCAPPRALREAAPALDREPVSGGVPPAVRGAFGPDSSVVGRHARIAGGGDGLTYWVVPHLRCDDPDAPSDRVCVLALFEGEEDADDDSGGACGTVAEIEAGRTWIVFPLRSGGGAAVAGFAPGGFTNARVKDPKGDFEQQFPVHDGIWGGVLADGPPQDSAALEVTFQGRTESGSPEVAVLNGTTDKGLAASTMDALEGVNYRRAEQAVGNWSDHQVERTIVYSSERWLAERIAIYLGEKFDVQRPLARAMTDAARDMAPGADAVVVAGRDLAG